MMGGRQTVGAWLDADQRFGLEGSGFLLATQTADHVVRSDVSGAPNLRIPFVNLPPGDGFPLGESSFLLSQPGFATGGQTLATSVGLWGAEASGAFRALKTDSFSLSLLTGFRYLDLKEQLSIVSNENDLGVGSYFGNDVFGTRNQFYGGQIGARAEAQFGHFYGSITGKVALGSDHETVTVNGNSTVIGGFSPTGNPLLTPGGIFTQATNIGHRTRDELTAVPEVQMLVGYNITSNIKAFVGYDFLYVSNVVRPGDQIDRVLNFTASPSINGSVSPLPLMGVARPASLFNSSDFWAQGVNVGIQFSF
jgi:Putative beta barrel porin-7 (BBP7)